MFKLELVPRFELTSTTSANGKRFYTTPEGVFPSVTTVIGSLPNPWLEEWREHVGVEVAKLRSKRALARGKAIHAVAEKYLIQEDWQTGLMPVTAHNFHHIRPFLDRNVGAIYGIELALWSSRLQTAGRADLVCEWNGTPAIVDFKGSNYSKRADDIPHYFWQTTAYAMMFEERYGMPIPKIVIVMVVEEDDKPLIFEAATETYTDKVREVFG